MTRVLHTAGISDVNSVMFVSKIRGMVGFEHGEEIIIIIIIVNVFIAH